MTYGLGSPPRAKLDSIILPQDPKNRLTKRSTSGQDDHLLTKSKRIFQGRYEFDTGEHGWHLELQQIFLR